MTILLLLAAALLGLAALVVLRVRASLPRYSGTVRLPELEAPVRVTSDAYGVPTISAASRRDAFCALGYVVARDRLFQMDLLRRIMGGRLSEIMGRATIKLDTNQRTLGFNRVARSVVARLPAEQRAIAQAYTDGVNSYLRQLGTPPPEYLLLRARPAPWSLEDTILVGLYLFKDLTETADIHERMMTVMEACLPEEVIAFLTADEDLYTTLLTGGSSARRPLQPTPVAALAALLRREPHVEQAAPVLLEGEAVKGSNGWLISGSRTADGRAILVSDMHLGLTAPNVWYRVTLRYPEVELSGVVVPGTPAVIIGATERVAWGFTNLRGDVLDLVQLELNPDQPEQYRTPNGWASFETLTETIRVRGKPDVQVAVKTTIWGPVAQRQLLGRDVAVRWTALDPQACDLGLLEMDRARTLDEALRVVQTAGIPPMNAMIADADGRIGWTLCGRLPLRGACDGLASRAWSALEQGWQGYIPPEQLPLVVDPPGGTLVTANNRTVGADYPHVLGFNFSSGYRAQRISQELREVGQTDERAMFALQLNSVADFYEFYRALALDALTPEAVVASQQLAAARAGIVAWNGRADRDSRGLPILARLRELLAEAVFDPLLAACREADRQFTYTWNSFEQPLRQLLSERQAALLPDPERYSSWQALILACLERCCQELSRTHPKRSLAELEWGAVNRVVVRHPLTNAVPALGALLNMPRDPIAGSMFSIHVSAPWIGSSVRMVVAPGHLDDGLLHMPTGQSGHPFARHYKSQHPAWASGHALPLRGAPVATLELTPVA